MKFSNKILFALLIAFFCQVSVVEAQSSFGSTLSLFFQNGVNPLSNTSATSGGGNGLVSILTTYSSRLNTWTSQFLGLARVILGVLIVLDFVWLVTKFIMQGAGIVNQLQELVSRFLFYTLNIILVNNGAGFIREIFETFDVVAGSLESTGSAADSMGMFQLVLVVIGLIAIGFVASGIANGMVFMTPTVFEMLSGATTMAAATIMGMIAAFFIVYVEILFIIGIAPIVFALGGSSVTSRASLGLIKYSVGVGFKLVAMAMVASLARNTIELNDFYDFESVLRGMTVLIVCASMFIVLPDRMASLATAGSASFATVTLGDSLGKLSRSYELGTDIREWRQKNKRAELQLQTEAKKIAGVEWLRRLFFIA